MPKEPKNHHLSASIKNWEVVATKLSALQDRKDVRLSLREGIEMYRALIQRARSMDYSWEQIACLMSEGLNVQVRPSTLHSYIKRPAQPGTTRPARGAARRTSKALPRSQSEPQLLLTYSRPGSDRDVQTTHVPSEAPAADDAPRTGTADDHGVDRDHTGPVCTHPVSALSGPETQQMPVQEEGDRALDVAGPGQATFTDPEQINVREQWQYGSDEIEDRHCSEVDDHPSHFRHTVAPVSGQGRAPREAGTQLQRLVGPVELEPETLSREGPQAEDTKPAGLGA